MWADAQRDGRPAEYRWRPLWKFRNYIPCTMPQRLADVRCSSAVQSHCQYRRTQDLQAKWILNSWQNSVKGQEPPKCIYSVPAQETAKHRAKFGWPLVSDVTAVTKPRCETCWNLLGCPKLANESQPLVGWSSPYCEDMCRRYWCWICLIDAGSLCHNMKIMMTFICPRRPGKFLGCFGK